MTDPTIRAIAAQQLLDNEIFQALLSQLETEAVDGLDVADLANPASMVRATANLQAVRRLRAAAESLVTTGKAAERSPPSVA